MKELGFYVIEVYERVRNLSLVSVKGPKGLTDGFYGYIKSRKRLIFVIDSHDSVFAAVKKGCKVLNKVCEGGTIFQ